MEEIISYIMETPENVNGNILREKLKDFQKSGGSPSVLDDLIEGKSGIHLVSNAESVVDTAFAYNDREPGGLGLYLESVDLPNTTSIGVGAFAGCSALASVNLPKVTSIGVGAFSGCSALINIDLPKVTSIGVRAFVGISSNAVINLGAAEDEIEDAPWGAPNGVTINYTDGSIIVDDK